MPPPPKLLSMPPLRWMLRASSSLMSVLPLLRQPLMLLPLLKRHASRLPLAKALHPRLYRSPAPRPWPLVHLLKARPGLSMLRRCLLPAAQPF